MIRPLLLILLLLCICTSSGQVPDKISYQGLLTTSSGSPVQDGNYTIRFDGHDFSTGGTSFWNETHTVVPVQRGVFSVFLGSYTPFSVGSRESLFVEVTVQAGPGISSPIAFLPRTALVSVPYALRADTAAFSDSSRIAGSLPSDLVTGNHIVDSTITGSDVNSGSVLRIASLMTSGDIGVGTSTPNGRLDVVGGIRLTNTANPANYGALWDGGGLILVSGNNNPMAFYTADTQRVRITTEGRVGIGTSTPSAPLEVKGYAFSKAPICVYDSAGGSGASFFVTWSFTTREDTTLVEQEPNKYDFKLKRSGWYRIISTIILQNTNISSGAIYVDLRKNNALWKHDYAVTWADLNYASAEINWVIDSDGDDLINLLVGAHGSPGKSVYSASPAQQLSIEYIGQD